MKQTKMKILREIFLLLSFIDFAVFLIIHFFIKWNIKKCCFILGLGLIFLGVSFFFGMKIEEENNENTFNTGRVIFISLTGGILMCVFTLIY